MQETINREAPIVVNYPSVMKMEMSQKFSVVESETLEDFKKRVFTDFWSLYTQVSPSRMGIHGNYTQLRVFPSNSSRVINQDEEIRTTEAFQRTIEAHPNLSIAFVGAT